MNNRYFKYYQPTWVTVLNESALKYIPSSATTVHLHVQMSKLPRLSSNISSLTFQSNISSELPMSLKYLNAVGYDILPELPPLLTHLIFDLASRNAQNWILPPSLTHVKFYFGECSLPSLPSSLQYLTLTGINRFRNILTELPPSLKFFQIHIALDTIRVPPLPSTLEHLEVNSYDIILPEKFPDSLKVLILATYETQLNSYPPNLIRLVDFSEQILPPFPPSLQSLSLNPERVIPLPLLPNLVKFEGGENMIPFLPSTVTHLSISTTSSSSLIPPNIIHLTLCECSSMPPLPPTLVHLRLLAESQMNITELPPSLQYLTIRTNGSAVANVNITSFPPTIKVFQVPLMDIIPNFPPTLQVFNIYKNSNATTLPPLPPSLHTLSIATQKGKTIKMNLPTSLMNLVCTEDQYKTVKKNLSPACDISYVFTLL